MRFPSSLSRFALLARFYSVGLLNLAVGYGLYAGLVALGLNIYLAQIISHILGMSFNYISYSQHVFRQSGPAKTRFMLSYAVNYGLSVVALAIAAQLIASPYAAGLVAAIAVSAINFFVLKHLVFVDRTGA